MGLVTNRSLSSQTEIPGIPAGNFPNFFVNGKRPRTEQEWSNGTEFSRILGQPREVHPKFRNEIPENAVFHSLPLLEFPEFFQVNLRVFVHDAIP